MFNLLKTVCLAGMLAACSKSSPPAASTPAPAPDTIPANSSRSLLALGDSYTIGQSVPDSVRFPNQAKKILGSYGKNISTVRYVATTGWTTADLQYALQANPITNTYDYVSLLIGVNNQYQGRSLEEYKVQFTDLLQSAIRYAGNRRSHVFVVSIPDYSVTPFAASYDTARISREIDQFNAANFTISQQYGVNYINITPGSRDARYDPSLVAYDGLHPSGKEYTKWAIALAAGIQANWQ